MGYVILIFLAIFFLHIGLRIALAFLSVFGEHIILFDSILLAVLAWALGTGLLKLHSALAFLLGVVVFFLLFFLQRTTVGFYLIGLIMSLAWGAFFGLMALIFTSDALWVFVAGGLGTVMVIGLHFTARGKGISDFEEE